MSTAVEL
jgi:hypothetical protein